MVDDKNKKKVVTDEDVSKLLEDLLGATGGEASPAAETPVSSKPKFMADEPAVRPLLSTLPINCSITGQASIHSQWSP